MEPESWLLVRSSWGRVELLMRWFRYTGALKLGESVHG